MAKKKKYRNSKNYFSKYSSTKYVTNLTYYADAKDVHQAATQVFGSTYYVDYHKLTSS